MKHICSGMQIVLSTWNNGSPTGEFNNAAQIWNHTFFWNCMAPNGGGEPTGALADAINSAFGSFADFQSTFKDAGVNQFGSGWSFLIHNGSGLEVAGYPNQDNPILDGKTAILGVDVWEHAYYLKYQNKRPDYLEAFFNVINWPKVSELFSAAG